MTKVPVDIILLIRPVKTYRFDDVAARIRDDSLPRFFGLLQAGGTLWHSEVLLAVITTTGVKSARIVRLSRATGSGGIPPTKLEFAADETATIGHVVVELDPQPSAPPFPS